MDFLERFTTNAEYASPSVTERRDTLIAAVHGRYDKASFWQEIANFMRRKAQELSDGEDIEDQLMELEWIKLADPRPGKDGCFLDVQPRLGVDWVEDGSGFGAYEGFTNFYLYGRLPSGEVARMGYMDLFEKDFSGEEDHYLLIDQGSEKAPVLTSWATGDADLFLTLAEAALQAQPA